MNKSRLLKFTALFIFLFAFGNVAASAQVALDFSDTTPALESGTALSAGAVYRFQNVAPGTDALVTVAAITANTTLVAIDNPSPFPARLQPIILTRNANAVGYVRFDFRLVKAGTSISLAVPYVLLSAQDIDGTTSANREFVEFVGMQSAYVSSNSKLDSRTAIAAGGVSYMQQSPGESQSGIGTDDAFEFYGVLPNSTATFSIIGGNLVGPQDCAGAVGSNNCDRLNSYAFDPPSSNVTVAPDVSITKTGPASVNQNGTVTYTLIARNNGPTTAHGATVTDNVPSTLTGVTISCAAASGAACPATAGLTTLSNEFIPTFPNGGQLTFTITGTASTAGTLTNTATIAPPNGSTDPTPANNTSATVTTTVLPVADLSVVKSQRQGTSGAFQTSALTVNQNSTVQYQLLFTNGGSATATNAVLSDTVPSNLTGLSVVSATGASGATACTAAFAASPNQNNLTGNFSGASGATCTVIVQGTATTVGSVTNTAQITPANIAVTADPDCSGAPVVCTGNNSSSVSTVISALYSIAGTIFEDVNYAGGSGRTLSASGGVGRGAARVELYNSAGAFVSAVDTIGGSYSFSNLAAGGYTIRVVNSTVTSSRGGASLIGVQTFRTNAGASDAARVGGEDPTKVDAAANTTSASLSSLTTATTTAQSISAVTVSSANIANVDFGFNFDTIVNVNDSGQGSLRQFITNANALSGADTTIFMISDGAAHNGLRAGLTNQLTSGVAVITLASLLPAVSDSNTTIDGTSQTTNVGNTNSGSLGVGGTVGVGNLSLSTVARPEVLITDGATNLQIGLDLQGASETVRGIAIYGFGAAPNSDANANIRLGASASNALVEQNILGTTATSFTDTGSATRSVGDNIRSVGADNGVLRNNLIGFSAGKGFGVENGSTGWTIENNEIRGNGIGNSYLDGVDLESAGTTGNTVRGNLVIANEGVGVDSFQSSGSNTIVNNTITGNGVGTSGTVETAGIRVFGANNTIDRNIVNANYGAGVMVNAGASASTITRNSIYANGTILNKSGGAASNQIGIDLQTSTDSVAAGTAPFVTVNDSGDGDAGANGLLNFPVLETARVVGGNLVLTGFARPGANVEFFIAAPDASGFGEGQTFLVTLTEGSSQDADATTGTYTSPFRGLTIGTDTTNRFQFTITLPSGVGVGTNLTATATLANATSEFSNVVPVGNAPPAVNLLKSVTPDGVQMPGAELTYTINFSNTGGAAASNFRLTDPDPSNATLRLNTSTDFKVGSVNNSLATTGLTATITYSNDNGATYAYTPVSAGGGAPAGFDRNVTHIRWTFAGSLSPTAPNNAGSVSFVVRIR